MEISDTFEVEEVDISTLPEKELEEFKETQPLKIDTLDKNDYEIKNEILLSKKTEEEISIKKFINGETSFTECFSKIENMNNEEEDTNQFDETENYSQQSVMNEECIEKNYRKPKRRQNLNASLLALMGEANLSVARGKIDIAKKICFEIIRQNPLLYEPFLTLAQIYEHEENSEKYLQFLTIAAHLEIYNLDNWIRLADIHIKRNDFTTAKHYFLKGIKYFPKDLDIRLQKIKLLEQLNDERGVMQDYYNMLFIIPPEKARFCVEIAKKVAQYFHKELKINQACESMKCAYNLAGHLFSIEEVNLYLELLIMIKDYKAVLIVLKNNTNFEFEEEYDNNEIIIVSCIIPKNFIPDFRVKLCVSLIHLKVFHILNYLIETFLEAIEIESSLDWYVEVIEALMEEEKYEESLKLLRPIINSENCETFQTPPYVWLCYANCNRIVGKINEAIDSYQIVIERAPRCYDARFTLSSIFKQLGRYLDAIKVLEQDLENDSIDIRLLYERCLMLKYINDFDQYIKIGYFVLLKNSMKLKTREEVLAAANAGFHFRPSCVKTVRQINFEEIDDDSPNYAETEHNLSIEDEYELFKDLISTCYKLKKYSSLMKICMTAIISKSFRSKYKQIQRITMYASILNNDFQVAFIYFREAVLNDKTNNFYWNIYGMITQSGDEMRYRKFMKRQFSRISHILVKASEANYFLYSGSYKYALNEYIGLYKATNDPLAALCISVSLSQLAGQRNITKRPTAAAHSIAFMHKYAKIRKNNLCDQEIFYNLGRLHHQLGLFHLAVYYYEKVLDERIFIKDIHKDHLNLTFEAAFNLHLIYKSNGNFEVARKYLYDYIVI